LKSQLVDAFNVFSVLYFSLESWRFNLEKPEIVEAHPVIQQRLALEMSVDLQ
jgi:hypothetical protein